MSEAISDLRNKAGGIKRRLEFWVFGWTKRPGGQEIDILTL
jgi:hypothetical protein